ncbi:NTF2-like N-terminal transpeptidase domain-containing protein [Paenibacillus azoreducens]|uniref:NTF2-like N-terminal transpeptidase domain-containing protein n=1 Tax=Paenibacillus azoreducens TaxID=116718 RepID=A0A920CQD5_9BACL|nr:NTF2-like N-terminal transpeptidase domain-containing protein [Paenibacillus azoreducens]GIO45328.1 hypothetical protein J34TS1_00930 [Paenibacillus azoreducens]
MKRTQTIMYGLMSVLAASVLAMYVYFFDRLEEKPEAVVENYFLHLKDQDFDRLYNLMSIESLEQSGMTREQFVQKYKSAFVGMGVSHIEINAGTPIYMESTSDYSVDYTAEVHTVAGELQENDKLILIQENSGDRKVWRIRWEPNLLLPNGVNLNSKAVEK